MKKGHLAKGILIGAVAGALNGLFGSGGGLIVVPALKGLMKLDAKKAHATSVAVIGALSIVSAFFYLRGGAVNLMDAVPYLLGGIVGGFLGGKLLAKVSNVWLSRLFGGFMIYAALRMLFWS